MEINRQDTNGLNAVLKVKVGVKDYQEKVDNILKDYRKKMQMPGFRPGMVPIGMVKKMYGKAVLADEINKLLNDSIYKYIEENKLEILGNPLPKDENKDPLDLDKQTEFEFEYELGFAPKFEVQASSKDKFTKYKVIVDEKVLDKYIKDISRRYGKVSESAESTIDDMLSGTFKELDKNGNLKENGITNESTISVEYVDDEKVKKSLTGLKVGDKVKFDPKKTSKGTADLAAMLNIKKKQAEELKSNFEFTVNKIFHIEGADLNQEFFDKLFGKDNVKSVEEFRSRVAEEVKKVLEQDSERKLMKDIIDYFIEKLNIELPDNFLKKWISAINKAEKNKASEKNNGEIKEDVDIELPDTEIEEGYDEYAKNLRWQLIENKIIKENNITVSPEEAVEHAGMFMKKQIEMYGITGFDEEKIKEMASRMLQKEEEAKKIYRELYDKKINEFFKTTFSLKEKEVSYDEFIDSLKEKSSKFKIFDNISKIFS